jgi:glycosyltransferase involved in cell wall biosynthesis
MISVVILTFNETINIQRCLDSVKWSDDILVMDSGSTDDTVEIARRNGARVLSRKFDTFANQRNHAMQNGALKNQWVLHLDADEVVTEALRKEMLAIAGKAPGEFPVYRIPSRIIFMGSWLKHAGMYPSYQVRFGRNEDLRFADHGHGQREVQSAEKVGTLSSPMDHYNFSKGINEWFARHLRYARAEAELAFSDTELATQYRDLASTNSTLRRRALKKIAYRMPLRPALRFFYVYIVRAGFLDGRAGFHYAVMMAIYQYFINANESEWKAMRDRK